MFNRNNCPSINTHRTRATAAELSTAKVGAGCPLPCSYFGCSMFGSRNFNSCCWWICMFIPGKSYTGEGSASFKKLKKTVWRPKGRQLDNFRGMLFAKMKKNCCISLSCLPSGLPSCFQAIWSFPSYKISLIIRSRFSQALQSKQRLKNPK